MTITKHAKERFFERFKIKSESEIRKVVNKLEHDFIRNEVCGDGEHRTILWRNRYLMGIIRDNHLITVVDTGCSPVFYLTKSNPSLKNGKDRYRNKMQRSKKHEKTFYR